MSMMMWSGFNPFVGGKCDPFKNGEYLLGIVLNFIFLKDDHVIWKFWIKMIPSSL